MLEEQPLLLAVNREHGFPIRYRLTDYQPPEGVRGLSNEFVHPDQFLGAPVVELDHDSFLARTVHKEAGEVVSVREFIKFMAHVEGAVHFRKPRNPMEEAL